MLIENPWGFDVGCKASIQLLALPEYELHKIQKGERSTRCSWIELNYDAIITHDDKELKTFTVDIPDLDKSGVLVPYGSLLIP